MKKVSQLNFIFFCLLFLFSTNYFFGQTLVPEGIYYNTTWTKSESPYLVMENTVVFEEVVLTIEQGVTVQFATDAAMKLRGQLIALGAEDEKIRFTSNSDSPQKSDWEGITVLGTNLPLGVGNQITMEHCIVEYAHTFVDLDLAYHGPYLFRNCRFANNHNTNFDTGMPLTLFEDCTFESNDLAVAGGQFECQVINSSFLNNAEGVCGADLVENCYFSGHTQTALSPSGLTIGCIVENNNVGVRTSFDSVNHTFINNVVKDNVIGVEMLRFFNGSVDFTGNTICNNSSSNLNMLHSNNADLSDNCWCSSDSTAIRSMITDGYQDTSYGLVTFSPTSPDCGSSSPVPTVLDASLGESEILDANVEVKLFPVPFENSLKIVLEEDTEVAIILLDINGSVMLKQKFSGSVNIETHKLTRGFYFYQIIGQEGLLKSGKVLKN